MRVGEGGAPQARQCSCSRSRMQLGNYFQGTATESPSPYTFSQTLNKFDDLVVAGDDEEVSSDLLNRHVELVDDLPKDRPWPPFSDVRRSKRRKRVMVHLYGLAIAALIIVVLALVAMAFTSKEQQNGAGPESSPSDLGLGGGRRLLRR